MSDVRSPGHPLPVRRVVPIGKAKFVPVAQTAEAAELPDHDYPFLLNTGRILYHWHGGTLTRRVQGLLELAPRLEVAINPEDARRLGIEEGTPIRLISRRGELIGFAQPTDAVRPGEIFIPFVKLAESGANILTNSAFDPFAKIPNTRSAPSGSNESARNRETREACRGPVQQWRTRSPPLSPYPSPSIPLPTGARVIEDQAGGAESEDQVSGQLTRSMTHSGGERKEGA